MSDGEMSDEIVPLEMRLAHLEQMVEILGKYTEIHMRSSVQKRRTDRFFHVAICKTSASVGDSQRSSVNCCPCCLSLVATSAELVTGVLAMLLNCSALVL